MTDAELIQESLVHASAFALLFDRHYRALYRFLRARVGAQLAEDLASETFTIAFRRRRAYDASRLDARPWLYGIAVNLLREHRRTEERRLRAYARVADVGEAPPPAADELDPAVSAALLGLSLDERTLLLLHAWADLGYEQLAEALALPVGTVRSRLSRARAKVRASLEPAGAVLAREADVP